MPEAMPPDAATCRDLPPGHAGHAGIKKVFPDFSTTSQISLKPNWHKPLAKTDKLIQLPDPDATTPSQPLTFAKKSLDSNLRPEMKNGRHHPRKWPTASKSELKSLY